MAAPFRITRPGVGAQAVAQTPVEGFRFYLGRLLLMIPAEVVSLYLVGRGFIPEGQANVLTIWTIICLIGVVVIRVYGTADPGENKPPDWTHVLISTIAFVIWVYSMGGVFEVWGLADPMLGSLLVLAWTFFVPIFYKGPAV